MKEKLETRLFLLWRGLFLHICCFKTYILRQIFVFPKPVAFSWKDPRIFLDTSSVAKRAVFGVIWGQSMGEMMFLEEKKVIFFVKSDSINYLGVYFCVRSLTEIWIVFGARVQVIGAPSALARRRPEVWMEEHTGGGKEGERGVLIWIPRKRFIVEGPGMKSRKPEGGPGIL